MVLSGHARGPLKTRAQSTRSGRAKPRKLPELVERGVRVASEGRTSELLLFECNTPHVLNLNISPWLRSNLFFVYNSVSNALIKSFAADRTRPSFSANRDTLEALELNDPYADLI